jgi:hypothetical protein
MMWDVAHHSAWDLLEAHVGRVRSVLEGENSQNERPDCELARQLGMELGSLSQSEKAILANAISEVQVRSKLWLLKELFQRVPRQNSTILVLGGWCGVLPWLAKLTVQPSAADWKCIDVDPEALSIGEKVFGHSTEGLSFICEDIYNVDYSDVARQENLIVINTICEHLPRFSAWRSLLPGGTLSVLQSNNFRGCPDHVNCVDSVEELLAAANLQEVMFKGALPLSLFTRFMVIGRA